MFKFALALSIALAAPVAVADSTWLNVGGVSWHPFTSGKNGSNPGLGLEWQMDNRRFITAGMYRNSQSTQSRYAAYGWRPYDNGTFSSGIITGVVDGYQWRDGGVIPMIAPYIMLEGKALALNVVIVPRVSKNVATTVALQIKYRMR